MAPVCTMMIGRLDDWMQVLVKRDGIDIDPACATWAGSRRSRRRMASSGNGGTDPRVRRRVPASRPLVRADRRRPRPDHPVRMGAEDQRIGHPGHRADAESCRPADRRRAVHARFPTSAGPTTKTASPAEFDGYGATVRTLRSFIASVHDLAAVIRDFMLPESRREIECRLPGNSGGIVDEPSFGLDPGYRAGRRRVSRHGFWALRGSPLISAGAREHPATGQELGYTPNGSRRA